MNKAQWIAAVDQLMRSDWRISVEDAGIDEWQFADHLREGETPPAFVAWFGEKYDLTRFEHRSRRPSVLDDAHA